MIIYPARCLLRTMVRAQTSADMKTATYNQGGNAMDFSVRVQTGHVRCAVLAIILPTLIVMIVVIGGCSSSSEPEPEPVVPGAFLASENQLYWSELTATGADRLIGTVRTDTGAVLALTDIAQAPDGALFAVSRSQLYSVDRETAVASPVGPGLPDRTNALCFNAAGDLYAASGAGGALYRVDRTTGSVTMITYGSSLLSSGDLVFTPDGVLLSTVVRTGDSLDTLVAISLANGVATVIRSDLPNQMYGLCMVHGAVYGAAAGNGNDLGLYLINHRNGSFVRIRTLRFAPVGAKASND